MSDLPADTLTTTIAKVLVDHPSVPTFERQGDFRCPSCPDAEIAGPNSPSHAAHQAAAVVSVLATHNEQMAADALRDAADALNHDAVGFQPGGWGSNDRDRYGIDLLSKAVHWLRARADRLAAVSPTPPAHKEQA